ncbi:hypothetical protein [Alteribacillus sp. YIM 98480]|uniref:hypothetical protein n=1 Tax=Alteribacillus sp. YIM 98480 TaxID=2606599 RepID=UPI00131E7FC6|nr:hypothetical protein [Alteribacillus sp. YIM 98480]
MEWLIIILLLVSVLLFSCSFLLKNKDQTKDELEQLSLNIMGEVYHIKKRLQLLEEELLTTVKPTPPVSRSKTNKELVNEAYNYFQQNMSVHEIAAAMQLKEDEVKYLLASLQ